MYFKDFPDLLYKFTVNGQTITKVVKDITTNVRLRVNILSNITLFDQYDLKEGDTPEIIAANYYGSSEYHWIVMLANQKFHWVEDFPLTQFQFNNYIVSKYTLPYGIHHYESPNGHIISADQFPQTAVTNYEYEQKLNEQKRTINLISPTLISNIVNELKKLI